MPALQYMPEANDVEAARSVLDALRAGKAVVFGEIPERLRRLLLDLLTQIARNEPVAIMPLEAQLTTK